MAVWPAILHRPVMVVCILAAEDPVVDVDSGLKVPWLMLATDCLNRAAFGWGA